MKHIKHESRMSNDARIAVLEISMININATLLDMRQDNKRMFDKMDNRFDNLEKKMDIRFEGVNTRFESVDNRFDNLEKKMDNRFEGVNTRFEGLNKNTNDRLETMSNRMWYHFFWLMGLIIGLAGLIARAQHWI